MISKQVSYRKSQAMTTVYLYQRIDVTTATREAGNLVHSRGPFLFLHGASKSGVVAHVREPRAKATGSKSIRNRGARHS